MRLVEGARRGAPRPATGAVAEGFLPYRNLAVRVIDQALRDAASRVESGTDRESARAFLAGSSMLSLWCEVAAIDPEWVVARADAVMARWRRRT